GVVIADRPLTELVPLYRDPRSETPATQFNMKYVEQAGLVKFDFLGLKTLTVIEKAAELVGANGQNLDVDHLPLDNKATFDLMGRAETTGVFQLEGTGMRDVLRRFKPNRFEDIIALVSLYRPGPMENIPLYIDTKQGRKKPDYLHPMLEPILKETFGIMIYQEQVMQVAQVLANYSLGQADLLRRAMGKKIKEEMAAQKQTFIEGAAENGVSAAQSSGIFDQVDKFAGYGFNKSHAAAYALVAYQTGYLKANHPVEFFAASMTLDQGNTDKLNVYRQEVRRMGISLFPPDINHSEPVFSVETVTNDKGEAERGIRYSLGAIKGVGVDAMQAVSNERAANGPFRDLFDFVERVEAKVLNKRQLEHLTAAGAFDGLQSSRAMVDRNLEFLMRHAQAAAHEKASGQTTMFDTSASSPDRPRLMVCDDWQTDERQQRELQAVGFYLTSHPIDAFDIKRLGCRPLLAARDAFITGAEKVRVACVVTDWREQMTRHRKRMCFATISDPEASLEVTVFEEQLPMIRPLAEPGSKLLMTLEARIQDDNMRISVVAARDLEGAMGELGSTLDIHVADNFRPATLLSVLERIGKGAGEIVLHVPVGQGRCATLTLPERYKISQRGQEALKSLPGIAWLNERPH
ncbi:MAG: DNA polymerase III subunit alpha, partial [Pseudomonadota bacterium]